jgi:hypothetical protein
VSDGETPRVYELKISDKVSGQEICYAEFEATLDALGQLIGVFYNRAQDDGANIVVTEAIGLGH